MLGGVSGFMGPGGDRLSHVLRRSTMGAEGFHGRVRDGIACLGPRYGHQVDRAHGVWCVFGCAFGLVVVGCVIRLFGFVGLVGFRLCALRAVFWWMV